MRSNTRLYLLALLLVAAGFVYGAASLFIARYTQGDAYPPYSSYRADPLGTRAFFESLQALPNVHVARNVDAIERAGGNGSVTLFVNGLDFSHFSSHELDGGLARALQQVMQRGGRVVISFAPLPEDISNIERMDAAFHERMQERARRRAQDGEHKQPGDEQSSDEEKPKAEADDETTKNGEENDSSEKIRNESIVDIPSKTDGSEENDADTKDGKVDDEKEEDALERERRELRDLFYENMPKPVKWDDQWGVALRFEKPPVDLDTGVVKGTEAARVGDAPLPASLSTRTALYFEPSHDWRTIYANRQGPVLIERSVGEGSLVLVADAYLLSNEAMRTERHADLLAWLSGPNGAILFDETTLGTRRTQGIASLMWQYRLQGVVITLIIIAALFIWKNGQPLVPPFHDALPTDAYAYVGKDSASGFTNLLKRSVPQAQVLRTCLAEWEKSFSHRSADLAESVRDAKAIILREDRVPAKQRDLMQAYKDICAAFSKHRLG